MNKTKLDLVLSYCNQLNNINLAKDDDEQEAKEKNQIYLIIDDNYNASVILQRQYEMGYKGVESACLLLRGENVDLKFVDTGGVVLNKDTRYSEEILEIIQEEKR